MASFRLAPSMLSFGWLVLGPLVGALNAHHEAIFGPQSSVLIARKRFVATQYYFTNQGRGPGERQDSHIGLLTVSTALGERWSMAVTLPIEAESHETEGSQAGVHDPVIGLRYFPRLRHGQTLVPVITFEPGISTLEHRAIGLGTGVVYGIERGHWSGIVYGLGRTEFSLKDGEKRGNRWFLGSGVAYEHERLPFSPQLGISWERTGRRMEHGMFAEESKTSAVMLHPTVVKEFRRSVTAFFVVSVPIAQTSGAEGWQRYRIAAGLVWAF